MTLLRRDVIRSLGLAEGEVAAAAALETAQLDELARRYRGERPAELVTDRDAIVVDDGLATVATATAALRSVRRERPRRLVLAVPICDADSARQLASDCDELVCVQETHELVAVGLWYETFPEVSDDEVRELLGAAARPEMSAWQKV